MYRSAFLGCGGRARGHAHAYGSITRGQIVAICDLNEERLKSFGDEFGVEQRKNLMCCTLLHSRT